MRIRTHRSLLDHLDGLDGGVLDGAVYEPEEWPVHPAGDSSRVDVAATIRRFARLAGKAESLIEREIEFLAGTGAGIVVCDIPSVPLVAASRLGLPALLLANFTWLEILSSYGARGWPARSALEFLANLYRHATALLRAQPAMRMNGFERVHELGLVCRPARPERSKLRRALGLPPDAKLIYVYVGRYGQADMDWGRVQKLLPYHFVSYQRIEPPSDNWHVADAAEWPANVLLASADACVCKAGYTTVADCMRARVPLVFPPRQGFAEHRVLRKALLAWGGGVTISGRQFRELRWRRALETACSIRPNQPPWPTDGAEKAAKLIRSYAETARAHSA